MNLDDPAAPSQAPEPTDMLGQLHRDYREVKHSVNNALAVIMALSELGQRDPKYFEKLADTVLKRGPQIVAQMNEYQAKIEQHMAAEAGQA